MKDKSKAVSQNVSLEISRCNNESNICVIEVPEGENREQIIFERIMVEKFEELMKDMNIQEAECT